MATKRTYQSQKKEPIKTADKEVRIIIAAAVMLFLELCLFAVLGKFGGWIRYGQFGLFGLAAYIFPVMAFLAVLYDALAKNKQKSKFICGGLFFLFLCAFLHLVNYQGFETAKILDFFTVCAKDGKGGGILGGLLALGLFKALGKAGAYIIIILVVLVCLIIICEVPLIEIIKKFFRKEEARQEEEEPDKVFVKRPVTEPEPMVEYRQTRIRKPKPRPWDKDNELVYQTKNEDGVVIKIVQAKKPSKKPRALLERTKNKAHPLRPSQPEFAEERPKVQGISNNLVMTPKGNNIDEIIEITKPQEKPQQAKRPLAQERRTHTAEQGASVSASAAPSAHNAKEARPVQQKIPREKIKPTSKITSETLMVPDKKPSSNQKKPAQVIPDDVEVRKIAPVKHTADEGYVYPPLSLLAQHKGRSRGYNEGELDKVAENLEVILSNFGVTVKVIDRQVGPSVTRYELQPEVGTRVNKITSLEDDLKLNLAVSDIRIEAPIPGRAAIGIEIPNTVKETVLMRDLLEDNKLRNHKSKIAFAAGVDIGGEVIVEDIAKMPHLLVAGTTGSGKSTFINTILMAILYRAKPSEVGLIIIDPKKIEFGIYAGIPHLIKEVVTDPGQAVSTLRWAVNEMTNRYQRMQLSGVRDFQSYNEKFDKNLLNPEEENPKRMPQIVIVIDELADLMMVASKDAEAQICRIAQLARAAGIHLIIATQRPSVDVVTGLIKANIPARVALLVASQVDSRTIIDRKGAEDLLGNGDMLFYPTGSPNPKRVQGAFVSEEEVTNVINFLKKNKTENYFAEEAQQISAYMNNEAIGESSAAESSGRKNAQDEYLFEAGKLCIEMGKASSSMLQRHFSIGFNRAAKIIDQLTEMGAISQPNGAKPREILVDSYTFEELFEMKDEA